MRSLLAIKEYLFEGKILLGCLVCHGSLRFSFLVHFISSEDHVFDGVPVFSRIMLVKVAVNATFLCEIVLEQIEALQVAE